MKFYKSAALVAALFLGLAGSAMATTWSSVQSGNFRVSRAVINSGTTPTGINSASSGMTDTVYLSSTTPVSVTITRTLQDGTVLTSETIAVTNGQPVSKTYPSPQSHQQLNVTASTALSGTNTLHAVVIESR